MVQGNMFSISKNPTIKEMHTLYKEDKATPTQVISFFLNRSKEVDKKVETVLRYTEELAIAESRKYDEILEEVRKKGQKDRNENWFEELTLLYPLFGIPFALKDNFLVEGQKATSASKILEGFVSPYSSTAYLKLKDAGAVLLAQVNLDEWAMGSSTENSAYGPSHNPFDFERVSGGSSGGSAAFVSSGQGVFALGSDTGGSIRHPSAFCNAVGSKSTYGSISRYGLMALSSSLDQIGAITNSVLDNIIITAILSGKGEEDQTTSDTSKMREELISSVNKSRVLRRKKTLDKSDNPLRIGFPKEYFSEGLNDKILAGIQQLVLKLKRLGHEIVEVELPLTEYGVAIYQANMAVETASNLQRYDGVRYGWDGVSKDEEGVSRKLFEQNRGVGFGDEPKRRIMFGTFASSSLGQNLYEISTLVKEKFRQDFDQAFKKVDVLLTPTTPEFPFKFGEKNKDPLKMYLSDMLLLGVNLAKLPAISVPMGFADIMEERKIDVRGEYDDGEFDTDAILALEAEKFLNERNESSELKVEKEEKAEIQEKNSEEDEKTEIDFEKKTEKVSFSEISLTSLPFACQVIAPEFEEKKMFDLAEEIEFLVKSRD